MLKKEYKVGDATPISDFGLFKKQLYQKGYFFYSRQLDLVNELSIFTMQYSVWK